MMGPSGIVTIGARRGGIPGLSPESTRSHASFFTEPLSENLRVTVPSELGVRQRSFSDSSPSPLQEDKEDEEEFSVVSSQEENKSRMSEAEELRMPIPLRPPIRPASPEKSESDQETTSRQPHKKSYKLKGPVKIAPTIRELSKLRLREEDEDFGENLDKYLQILNRKWEDLNDKSRVVGGDEAHKHEIKKLLNPWTDVLNSGYSMLLEEKNPGLRCNKKKEIQNFCHLFEELLKDRIASIYIKDSIGKKETLSNRLKLIIDRRKEISPLLNYRIEIKETEKVKNLVSKVGIKNIHTSISRNLKPEELIACAFQWIVVKSRFKDDSWLPGSFSKEDAMTTWAWYENLLKMVDAAGFSKNTRKQYATILTAFFSYVAIKKQPSLKKLKKENPYYSLLQCLANGFMASGRLAIDKIWPFIKHLQTIETQKKWKYELKFEEEHGLLGEIKIKEHGKAQVKQHRKYVFRVSIKEMMKSKIKFKKETKAVGVVDIAILKWQTKVDDINEMYKTFVVRLNDLLIINNIPSKFKNHIDRIQQYQRSIFEGFKSYQGEEVTLDNGAVARAMYVSPKRRFDCLPVEFPKNMVK